MAGWKCLTQKKLKALEVENAMLKKLLVEQMMDVSKLKEMLGKTFEAGIATQRCDLGHEREAILSETSLCIGRYGSTRLPTRIEAAY